MSNILGKMTTENNKKTLLSIIVPAYNCEAYLKEGLDSILCQMTDDHELIVVDDGSSDGTGHLLAEYEGRKENVHICYEEHRGASAARNAGLECARGECVTFMDCDDCLQDGFLAQSRPLLFEKAALCIFGIERVMPESSELWKLADHEYDSVSDFADEYIRKRKMLVYSNCNKYYSNRIIKEAQIRFEEGISFGEDRLFNYRFLTECSRILKEESRVITSSIVMLKYMLRSEESMSTMEASRSEDLLMMLHRKKMDCFMGLSRGTTQKERQDFTEYDLAKTISEIKEK
jgi:glycosyltransferase involved in cell wall biosynthesis